MSRRLLDCIARSEAGTSTIELALIAPIAGALMLATYDYAQGFAAKLELEQAAQRTTELAIANPTKDGSTAYLVSEAATASGQPTSNITVAAWVTCDGGAPQAYTTLCGADQQMARYISVTIRREFAPTFDYSGLLHGESGGGSTTRWMLVGDSTVRVQ